MAFSLGYCFSTWNLLTVQDCEEPWTFLRMLTLCNKFPCEVLSVCCALYMECIKAGKDECTSACFSLLTILCDINPTSCLVFLNEDLAVTVTLH